MKFVKALLLLVIGLLLYSCAAAPKEEYPYKTDYPLTDELAFSSVSDLAVRIPHGWFTAEDNDCKCIDIWLIRDDFSATINFIPIQYEVSSSSLENNTALLELLSFSKSLKQAKLGEKFQEIGEDEFLQLNGKDFASYQFSGESGETIRVMIFSYNGNFFELAAMPSEEIGGGKVNTIELFSVQQSVASSIKF